MKPYPPLIKTAAKGVCVINVARKDRVYKVLVDACYYDCLCQFGWFVNLTKTGKVESVMTTTRLRLKMHRWVMSAPAGVLVDHRNGPGGLMEDGITIDNRKRNLRLADYAQNRLNSKPNSGQTFKGVSFDSGGYQARLSRRGKKHLYLGFFQSPEAAAKAYDQAARLIFDTSFAYLNFPDVVEFNPAVQEKIDKYRQEQS